MRRAKKAIETLKKFRVKSYVYEPLGATMLKQAKYLVAALGLIGGAMGSSQAVAGESPLNCQQAPRNFYGLTIIILSCTAMVDRAVISKVVIDRGNKTVDGGERGKPCQASLKFGERLECMVLDGRFIEAVITVNGKSWTYTWQPQ